MRAICTPAAVTALTALVTACGRNVDGARALVRKSAYRSLQIVQAISHGPKRGSAPLDPLFCPAPQVIEPSRPVGPAGDDLPEGTSGNAAPLADQFVVLARL